MILGRFSAATPRCGVLLSSACRTGQLRFLAKDAKKGQHGGGGKQPSGAVKAEGPPGGAKKGATETPPGEEKLSRGGSGFTKSEMLAARQARKANLAQPGAVAANAVKPSKASNAKAAAGTAAEAESEGTGERQGKWGWGTTVFALTTTGMVALGIAWQLKPDEVRKLLDDSPIDHVAMWFMSKYQEYSSPVKEKLLADLPLGPGQQQPPVLVLDLEGTLLGTIYTRKNGWRVAKRPGLDAFLKEMAQFYEIAIFTDSSGGLADEWITKMDPHGQYISHRVFREGTRYIDGKYVKDLSALNRPLEKVVIIDDNPDCISLQPENAIRVKKFSLEDGADPTSDTVLFDLAPFLTALAMQGVSDFRDVLRPHVGQDWNAVVSDYRSKVNAVRQREADERGRGLGGLVRQMAPAVSASPPMASGGMMTSKDIVGDAPGTLSPGAAAVAATAGAFKPGGGDGAVTAVVPIAEEKKGGLWKTLDEGSKERQDDMMRKQEVFQRVMEKRNAREQAREKARTEALGAKA